MKAPGPVHSGDGRVIKDVIRHHFLVWHNGAALSELGTYSGRVPKFKSFI